MYKIEIRRLSENGALLTEFNSGRIPFIGEILIDKDGMSYHIKGIVSFIDIPNFIVLTV